MKTITVSFTHNKNQARSEKSIFKFITASKKIKTRFFGVKTNNY